MGSYDQAIAGLRARAFARPPRRFLTPIGLLYEETDAQGFTSRRVALGVSGNAGLGARPWTGVVAVAPNFGVLRDLCEDRPTRSVAANVAAVADELAGCPEFEQAPQLPLRRILVCGFRPATVGLLEALVLAEPQAQILVLLDDEASLAAAAERFREHRSLAEYRMVSLSPGSFIAQEDGSFVYQPRLQEAMRCGRVHLAVGDRSSLLQFVELPAGFGHAGDLDLALLLATRREDGDARTTQSLLALEVARSRGGVRSSLRVVAEVVEAELCARLRRRACLRGDDHVQVYALREPARGVPVSVGVDPGVQPGVRRADGAVGPELRAQAGAGAGPRELQLSGAGAAVGGGGRAASRRRASAQRRRGGRRPRGRRWQRWTRRPGDAGCDLGADAGRGGDPPWELRGRAGGLIDHHAEPGSAAGQRC